MKWSQRQIGQGLGGDHKAFGFYSKKKWGVPGGATFPLALCDALTQPLVIYFTAAIKFYNYLTSLFTNCFPVSLIRMLTALTNFIQQMFIEHLPCTRQCSKYWKYS